MQDTLFTVDFISYFRRNQIKAVEALLGRSGIIQHILNTIRLGMSNARIE